MADFTEVEALDIVQGCDTLCDIQVRLTARGLTPPLRADLALKVEYRTPGGTTREGLYFCWQFDTSPANQALQDRSFVNGAEDQTMVQWYSTSELH
jgi:hypothetical protein